MTRSVTIAAGKKAVSLPDGGTYDAGATVNLSDEQFYRIRPALFPGTVIDNGAVGGSGGGGASVASEVASGSVAGATDKGIPALVVRRDAESVFSGIDDGEVTPMQVDSEGRLKVTSKPLPFPLVTGTITVSGQSVTADVSKASNVTFYCLGTFAGSNATFEGSLDGTNWFGIQVARTNANTPETTTGVLGAAPAYAWEGSVNAYNQVRVRATAFTSGTQTWHIQRGTYATEPVPVIQTHPVTGSGTFTVAGTLTSAGTVTNTPTTPTAYNLTTAATTNLVAVKTAAGTLHEITVNNPTATALTVKVYNKASVPTLASDIPVLSFTVAAGAQVVQEFGQGKRFAAGIAIAATALPAPTDTGVAVAGAIVSATYL